MTAPDLAALREKAEKASRQGTRWWEMNSLGLSATTRADADFIAAADPTTVLRLIDTIDELRGQLADSGTAIGSALYVIGLLRDGWREGGDISSDDLDVLQATLEPAALDGGAA